MTYSSPSPWRLALVGSLLLVLTGCPVGDPNGRIEVYNESDRLVEIRYRDSVIGQVEPGADGVFNPRPAQDGDCLIAPLEILNEDGQVIDQVDAGECYDRDIEVRVTDDE